MDVRLQLIIDILDRRGRNWTTATQIHNTALDRGQRLDQRVIAELASESDGQVLGTGDGYMFYTHATDQEILSAYRYNIRRAIGSDIRARSIIANARRHGRLADDKKILDVRNDVERELTQEKPKPAPAQPAQPPPAPTVITHTNTVSQTELRL